MGMIGKNSMAITNDLERNRSTSSSPMTHDHQYHLRHNQQPSSHKMNNNNMIKPTKTTNKNKNIDSWVAFDSSWSTIGGEGGDTEPDSTLYSNSSAESTN